MALNMEETGGTVRSTVVCKLRFLNTYSHRGHNNGSHVALNTDETGGTVCSILVCKLRF